MQSKLAVYDATNESIEMHKKSGPVLLMLPFVFAILLFNRKFYATQLRLNDD